MQKFYDTKTAIDGANIHLSMPIAKIDIEKRMVHGFATLDNVDRQQDVVPLEASIKAFEKFRGNLREQHDSKKAVGKVLSFTGKEYFDSETNNTYKGVFVSAYVSKGAQDTWEKVLDGTLTGFSIGGRILDFENKVDKETDGESVRIIKDFELMELSLVDSPANQLANILSVEKMGDKTVTSGIVSNIETENVFWCANDKIAITEKTDSCECPICNSAMHDIGWVESNDLTKNQEIGKLVDMYLRKADSVSVGDFVSWGASGGTARGKVERVVRSGSVNVPDSDFTINAEEGNPAVLIRVYRKGANGWERTDRVVGHKMSTLTRISSLDKNMDEEHETTGRKKKEMHKETVTNEVTPNRNAEQGIRGGIPKTRRKKKRMYKTQEGSIQEKDFVAFVEDSFLQKGRVELLNDVNASIRLYKENNSGKFVATERIVIKELTELKKLKASINKTISSSAIITLKELVSQHNEKYGNVNSKKVSFDTLREVYDRGIVAFRNNVNTTKSNDSSPEQWAIARVNGFLQAVKSGKYKNRPYDTDLLPNGHPLSTEKSENLLTLVKREGGVEMADNETSHEELDTAQAENEASEEVEFEVEETVEDVVTEALAMAKSDGVEAEVADDTSSDVFDMEKALGDVKSFVEEAITKSIEVNKESLDKFSTAVVELAKAVDEKIGQLQSKYEEVTKGLADLNNAATEIATRVESVEEETAIKKSGELESSIPEQPVVKKSLWGGRFLSSADLFN
jgi:Zn finger protein HypA/HybF involved in hydrogenase expression